MKASKVGDLIVWRKAHQRTLDVYGLTRDLPEDERFGLTSQMRRAAVSIQANIAEGIIRAGCRDKARFYSIGRASAEELRYFLLLVKDLGYLDPPMMLAGLLDEICAMLHRPWQVVLAERP